MIHAQYRQPGGEDISVDMEAKALSSQGVAVSRWIIPAGARFRPRSFRPRDLESHHRRGVNPACPSRPTGHPSHPKFFPRLVAVSTPNSSATLPTTRTDDT